MAAMEILEHISRLDANTMFTTREVLHYGSRGAVDTCLYRLVKKRFIRRLVRGVFMLAGESTPTIDEIAEKKATSFARRIYKFATSTLEELRIIRADRLQEKCFGINGHSSGFMSCHGPVTFRGIAPRKARLCETTVGERVNALWFLRANDMIDRAVAAVCAASSPADRGELRRSVWLMPAWLHEKFRERFGRSLARF